MKVTIYTLKMAQRDAALEQQDDLLRLKDIAVELYEGDVMAALTAMEDKKQGRADELLAEHAARAQAWLMEGVNGVAALVDIITPLVADIPTIVSDPMLALHDSHAYGRISITMDVSKSDDDSKPFFLAPVVVKVTSKPSSKAASNGTDSTSNGTSGKGVPLTATSPDGVVETRPSAAAWKPVFNGGASMSKSAIVASLKRAGYTDIA